ncbi:MAG: gliding motility-associated C-terminal domain-containing protein [Ferruginibacter sp.]
MIIRAFLVSLSLFFINHSVIAQCTLGQSPASAFPVCGTDTFYQENVPVCGGRVVPAPGCGVLQDLNPYWYRFTCFEAGTLAFLIDPHDPGDDYDWQIFDITGHNPEEVYTNTSLFVACNWSGKPGKTGAGVLGTSLVTCGNTGREALFNPYSSMPQLKAGHEYIMLISHFFGDQQSGYSLSFGGANGGTAVITDPKEPAMAGARAICDGEKIAIKLNKKMKCSSLNADGSDFVITPAIAPIISAVGVNCNNGFDMDSLVITLSGPIPPGTYVVSVKSDATGINLVDNCNRTIPDKQSHQIVVFPLIPTPMDSLVPPACAPDEIKLVFKKPMLCNSIAADGSDFTITNAGVNIPVTGALGDCDESGLTTAIYVKLAAPIQQAGNFILTLKTGTDGNTILNECTVETPAGSFLPFVTADTVSAAFSYTLHMGCKNNVVDYSHDGRNGVNSWKWNFGGIMSAAKDTSITYAIAVSQVATLIVSNGTCTDTAQATVIMDNAFNAAMENSDYACPEDPVLFKDRSTGKFIRQWFWDMGDGKTSTAQNPPQQFYIPGSRDRDLSIRLIVTDSIGCKDTAYGKIKVVNNCYIAVPKAFTPNGDGLNDFLYPTNAYKAKDLLFRVYNRGGQMIFETRNWLNKWDGSFKGSPQDPGTYVWTLRYTHTETGQYYNLKGSSVLLR